MSSFAYCQHLRNLAAKGEPRALEIINAPGEATTDIVLALAFYALAMHEVETSTRILDDGDAVKNAMDRNMTKIGAYTRALAFMWLDGSFEFSREFPFTKEDLRKFLASRGESA